MNGFSIAHFSFLRKGEKDEKRQNGQKKMKFAPDGVFLRTRRLVSPAAPFLECASAHSPGVGAGFRKSEL